MGSTVESARKTHTKYSELDADLPVGGATFIRDHAGVCPRVLPGHGVEGDASVREGDPVLIGGCGEWEPGQRELESWEGLGVGAPGTQKGWREGLGDWRLEPGPGHALPWDLGAIEKEVQGSPVILLL